MTTRLSVTHAINDLTSKFRPNVNVAHRGHPEIRVAAGSHDVDDPPFPPLRGWYPFEVFHFPVRSGSQMKRKFERVEHNVSVERIAYLRRALAAEGDTRSGGAFGELLVDDDELSRGREAGILAEDNRLRDVLRQLRRPDLTFAPPTPESTPLSFPVPSLVDDALFAVDAAAVGEAEVVRVQRRLDGLEPRIRVIERSVALRADRRARAAARRVKRALRLKGSSA